MIQKQPVVVNVTDNVVTPGGEPEIKVPNLPDHDYDVIYKDKDGNEVADLTESGTYEVWVKFPEDGNYRHPDGSTEAPVGSVTPMRSISASTPFRPSSGPAAPALSKASPIVPWCPAARQPVLRRQPC